jgi:hypothetical protein
MKFNVLNISRKSVEKKQVPLKSDKHVAYFIRGVNEFIIIFRQLFLK